MRRKLNEWADASKILHSMVVLGFILAFIISIFSCEDLRVGKTKEEVEADLLQTMWEVDSILLKIKYDLDTAATDSLFQKGNN